jgi:hypothetical protein
MRAGNTCSLGVERNARPPFRPSLPHKPEKSRALDYASFALMQPQIVAVFLPVLPLLYRSLPASFFAQAR